MEFPVYTIPSASTPMYGNLQMICFFKNGQVSATGCVNEPVPTELGVKFQPSVWGLGDWVNLGDGGCCCAAWRYTMSTPKKRG